MLLAIMLNNTFCCFMNHYLQTDMKDERKNECLDLRMVFGAKIKWVIREVVEKGTKWTIEYNFKRPLKEQTKRTWNTNVFF